MDQTQRTRERIAALGVNRVFLLAEQCKPANLDLREVSFEQVLSWGNPRLEQWLDGYRITDEHRRNRYEGHSFVLLPLPLSEVRLWPGAGGLPKDWTDSKSVRDLADWLTGPDASRIPPEAERLNQMRDSVARELVALEQLSVIPAIALPEFHGARRQELAGVPWTLDDGGHRALMLAMHGHKDLWCLVGIPHSLHADVPAALLDRTAGQDLEDRAAVERYLRGRDGQKLLLAGVSPKLLDRLTLGQLPPLPTLPDNTLRVLRDRVAVRRRAAQQARQAGLFRPTDDHGSTVASLVATAEFIRTHGPSAFSQQGDRTDETQPSQDEALRQAGMLGQTALEIVGIPPSADGNQSSLAQFALLELVRWLADGRIIEGDSGLVLSVATSGSAHPALALARDRKRTDLWLGRQIARAATVVADAAQVDQNWAAVQRYTIEGIAALLSTGGLPTDETPLPDVLALVRLLNRLGVSYRAQWEPRGLWWVEQAAAHHEAAIVLLRGRRPRFRAGNEHQLTQEYMLNSFTTLTNLASAWTEVVYAVYAKGETVDDTDLHRARALLMGLRDGTASATQPAAHKALHYGRSPGCPDSQVCLPPKMLNLSLKGSSNYKPWDWVLKNDLAEVNWRIAMHELKGRPKSSWTATKQPTTMQNCLTSALVLHENTITTLKNVKVSQTKDAVRKYWHWQHQKNLRNKINELLLDYERGDLMRGLPECETRPSDPTQYRQKLDTALADRQPARQLATLDAYHSVLHQVVLLDEVSSDGRR